MFVPTRQLKLREGGDGYWRTSWIDDRGKRHQRCFGNKKNDAFNRFYAFLTRWQNDRRVRNPDGTQDLTIREGWERFKEHAATYYRRPDGTPTGEADAFAQACKPLLDTYGNARASEFGPKDLVAVRDRMETLGWCLNTINHHVRRVRHVFRWMVSQEIVAPSVLWGLQTVAPLRPGRCSARVTDPIGPAPAEHVWKAVEKLPATLQAMVRVQDLTGMRPGEVCAMAAVDIDMTGKVWVYKPKRHKSAHRGRERIILLGPQAQKILKPFLSRKVTEPLFNPLEALRQRYATRKTHRHQPVPEAETERKVGAYYVPTSYARAIRRACREAKVVEWSPNQLRHNAATRLRREFGLDVAQIVLGHTHPDTTLIYAEADLQRAVAVMERVG